MDHPEYVFLWRHKKWTCLWKKKKKKKDFGQYQNIWISCYILEQVYPELIQHKLSNSQD